MGGDKGGSGNSGGMGGGNGTITVPFSVLFATFKARLNAIDVMLPRSLRLKSVIGGLHATSTLQRQIRGQGDERRAGIGALPQKPPLLNFLEDS